MSRGFFQKEGTRDYEQKSTMPIREFARLTGIRPANLRFYDQIGLLSPELRGENGYRYYSRRR